MINAMKPLVDSGLINESTRQSISEAWDTQLNEARDQIRAELKEEFANRYEHDRDTMVTAIDKLVTETLTAEMSEFQADKRAIVEDRVAAKAAMVENAGRFEKFMVQNLAEEISELRAERAIQKEAYGHLEKFIVAQLAEEIKEFHQDKRAAVNTKVKLVAEAKQKMAQLQKSFVDKSAKAVKETVATHLKAELTQLKEDVQVARENMFGRRLFEAYASEFAVTHLNENKEIAKLRGKLNKQAKQIAEAKHQTQLAKTLVESKAREVRAIKESTTRADKMAELVGTLNKEKSAVMRDLLESVQTDKLQSAFDKYLPAVLGDARGKKSEKRVLSEGRIAVTGDKAAKANAVESIDNNVFEIKRLAGLTK